MGLMTPIKPRVVTADNGAAFVSVHFKEFVASCQVRMNFAAPYTPQQNSYVERMWGYAFGTARVFLAAAHLPPSFHPFALQTALWVHNRLPRCQRDAGRNVIELRPPAIFCRLFGAALSCNVHVN